MTSPPLPQHRVQENEAAADPLALPRLEQNLTAARSAVSASMDDGPRSQDLLDASRRLTRFVARFPHPETDRFIALSSAAEWQRQRLQQVRASRLLFRRLVLVVTAVIAFLKRYALVIFLALLVGVLAWLLVAFWPEIMGTIDRVLAALRPIELPDIDTPP